MKGFGIAISVVGVVVCAIIAVSVLRSNAVELPQGCRLLRSSTEEDTYICDGRQPQQLHAINTWVKSIAGDEALVKRSKFGTEYVGKQNQVVVEDRNQQRQVFMEGKAGPPSGEIIVTVTKM